MFLLNVDIAMVKWESDGKGSCCLVSLWGLHVVLCGVHTAHLDRRSQTSLSLPNLHALITGHLWGLDSNLDTQIVLIFYLPSFQCVYHEAFLFSFANSWEK